MLAQVRYAAAGRAALADPAKIAKSRGVKQDKWDRTEYKGILRRGKTYRAMFRGKYCGYYDDKNEAPLLATVKCRKNNKCTVTEIPLHIPAQAIRAIMAKFPDIVTKQQLLTTPGQRQRQPQATVAKVPLPPQGFFKGGFARTPPPPPPRVSHKSCALLGSPHHHPRGFLGGCALLGPPPPGGVVRRMLQLAFRDAWCKRLPAPQCSLPPGVAHGSGEGQGFHWATSGRSPSLRRGAGCTINRMFVWGSSVVSCFSGVVFQFACSQVQRQLAALFRVYSTPSLHPSDLSDAMQALRGPAQEMLICHTGLHIVYVLLKYGPWRSAFVRAAGAAGFTGSQQDNEPILNAVRVSSVLRSTVLSMHKVCLGKWVQNVGRGMAYHSGGILAMKRLGLVSCCSKSGVSPEDGAWLQFNHSIWRFNKPESYMRNLEDLLWVGKQVHNLQHRLPGPWSPRRRAEAVGHAARGKPALSSLRFGSAGPGTSSAGRRAPRRSPAT